MNLDVKKEEKRHTCILCKRKKAESKMVKVRSHWTCTTCLDPAAHSGAFPSGFPGSGDTGTLEGKRIQVLNLYAGIGGNRKNWQGVQVTAVEKDLKVAAAYKHLYPNDIVIIADAHQYLSKNFYRFDFIWSSPPCQSHKRFNYTSVQEKKRYPDMSLYSEIILLRAYFKGRFIVENVIPYYEPLIKPDRIIGRHQFWCNFNITPFTPPHLPGLLDLNTMQDKQIIQDWLGIHYGPNLYLSGKNYIQVFRNCVHPVIGENIFKDFLRDLSGGDVIGVDAQLEIRLPLCPGE